MAHIEKFDKAKIENGNLLRHFERAKNKDGEYYQFSNQNIDATRTHLNYNLAPERDCDQWEHIKQRMTEAYCHKKKDLVLMGSGVLTAPKGLSDDEIKILFREFYKFMVRVCCNGNERNVISAYVHMDEKTPHIHFAFMPIVPDAKKKHPSGEKFRAKDLLDRKFYKKFHVDLDAHMTKVFGRDIGILNEATKAGNVEVRKLKQKAQIAKLDKEYKEITKPKVEKLASAKQIDKVRKAKKVEQKQYIVRGEKGVFVSGATAQDIEYTAEGAMQRDKAIRNANSRIDKAEQESKEAKAKVEKIEEESKAQIDLANQEKQTATDAWGEVLNVLKRQISVPIPSLNIKTKDDITIGNISQVIEYAIKTSAINSRNNKTLSKENNNLKEANQKLTEAYSALEKKTLGIKDDLVALADHAIQNSGSANLNFAANALLRIGDDDCEKTVQKLIEKFRERTQEHEIE